MPDTTARIVSLRAAGTCFVVELTEPVPRVLHWGADLGELSDADAAALALTAEAAVLNNALDTPRRFTIWPTEADGWSGTPAHHGHLAGAASAPRLRTVASAVRHDGADGGGELTVELTDETSGLDVAVRYTLDPSGVLAVSTGLTRRADADRAPYDRAPYDLAQLTTLLPLPRRATEILDFTGKWSRERSPQRRPLGYGTHARETRRGKPGLDSPYLLTVGVPGFGFRDGEVWAVHVAWSGDQRYLVERYPEGAGTHAAALGGGELLRAGEIRLAPGESYRAPVCHFAWSGAGLDGLAGRFHTLLRSRPGHPSRPRPVILNSWEAVYFDHDLDRLLGLVDRAAEVGVERFVLDDGWFRGRRSDNAGLGDWTVDPAVWPDGLSPLVDRVRSLGMEFGLWVEPEMVNLDSDLAREHPDWVLGPAAGLGPAARHQYVLDLANPDAWEYLFQALEALVGKYPIAYLKWDHNRELHEAVHSPADRPTAHAQVLALYRLLDTLKERHPELEIESCASGGGRIDLGILSRTDRVWTSDCNDPVERQSIQRWTAQLLPPELFGTHVGPAASHTTARISTDTFRLVTALFGHAGIEQDITGCTPVELARLTAWTALYRELRPLLHTGRTVRADLGPSAGAADEAALLHGVVSQDGGSAVYCWARVATSPEAQWGRVPLPGLAADARYQVRVRTELGLPSWHQTGGPAWLTAALDGWVTLPGAVLAVAGIPMPTLNPEHALLIEVRRDDRR
ncbi:alpha-galactosidase [Streptomyces sp. DvalAA-14]|uniref:alpha-galactosidase n=1 Tax=unclassified Streptomyces TaxID=2593676 RepID=UPI00081B7C27|nr:MULTISPECIES: alpha-galactosidase [unclassified Streptomyces]MYS21414.1 alpha-galactosidase [Streptomyces sp. SID4948]SCD92072.1 alpha-galactosidase [Streptomyces sp. DvalAA-14]